MQTENMWRVKMESRDRHSYEFCTIALDKEEVIKRANAVIQKNLWESFGYKIKEVSYMGEVN